MDGWLRWSEGGGRSYTINSVGDWAGVRGGEGGPHCCCCCCCRRLARGALISGEIEAVTDGGQQSLMPWAA